MSWDAHAGGSRFRRGTDPISMGVSTPTCRWYPNTFVSAVISYHSQVHPHGKVRRHMLAPGSVYRLRGAQPLR